MLEETKEICEYCDCWERATTIIWDTALVCDKHAEISEDYTGYCSLSCKLGYGCDESC